MKFDVTAFMKKYGLYSLVMTFVISTMIGAHPLQDSLNPTLFSTDEQTRNGQFVDRTKTLQAIMDTLHETQRDSETRANSNTGSSSTRAVGDNEDYGKRSKKALFDEFPRLFQMIKEDKGKVFGKVETPYVECPTAEDGLKLFSCPTPDSLGQYKCIDDHALCDNTYHCPNGEDEDRTVCMFHRMTMTYFRVLLDAVFGLTRSVI